MNNFERRATSDECIADLLRGLETSVSAPYDWAEFKRRSTQRYRGHSLRIAAAAAFMLVMLGAALWSRFAHVGDASTDLTTAQTEAPADSLPDVEATSRWLASLPREPAIVRVGTRVAVTDLEDHIAWIDDLLSAAQVERAQPAHIRTLQRERAQLIHSLAQVRYAETLAAER